jgi:hypothetical protein
MTRVSLYRALHSVLPSVAIPGGGGEALIRSKSSVLYSVASSVLYSVASSVLDSVPLHSRRRPSVARCLVECGRRHP